jgi:ABC-type multidrug transport system fused ATPase/permease subunit
MHFYKIKLLPIDKVSGGTALIAMTISAISEMALMAVIYTMVSGTTGDSNAGGVIGGLAGLSLKQIGIIALSTAILKVGTSYYAIQRKSAFIFYSQKSLAMTLYNKFIWKSYKDIEKNSAAELVRTIANETQNVVKMVLIPTVSIISELLPTVLIMIFALYLRPFESIVSFLSIGLIGYAISIFFKNKISEWGNLRKHIEERITAMLIDSDRLFKEITVYRRQLIFSNKFETLQHQLENVGRKQNFAAEIPKVFLESLVYSGIVLYLLYGLLFFQNPLEAIGTIAVIGMTALRVVPSVHRIVSAFNTIRFGLPSLAKITEELGEQKEANRNAKAAEMKECSSIEVINLSFRRSEVPKPIFSDISFTARKGEIIGIKGASGSGKTTFLNVMMGLLPASSGRILMDGKDISDLGLYNSTSLGIVPQQTYIFNGSVKDNLSLYDLSYCDWQVRARDSLKAARMLDFVDRFENRLDMQLSENSKDISGGQAQRFSIARSLYNNPEILLFDEFTSALDQRTQNEIISEIKEIVKNKIVIIVSHSSEVLSVCNKIIDLDQYHAA